VSAVTDPTDAHLTDATDATDAHLTADDLDIDPRNEHNLTGKPFVRLVRRGHVAELVLDRPEKLNAWAWAQTNELCALADGLREDPDVHVVVLRGEGRAFCAGEDLRPERHDVKERHRGRTGAEVVRHSYERARYCLERWRVLDALPQPVVVAVHGYCLGAGVELAMLGDIRIAADDAIFAFPQATIGVGVVGGADVRVAIECGAANARLLAMTGRRFGAEEALRRGVVQQVVPAAELVATVAALADELAAAPPSAVQAVLRTIDLAARRGFETAGRHEALTSSFAFASADLYEGFAAGAARRRAEFRGY
jgi:enoyl-CoA hydratase/carnithine racemase